MQLVGETRNALGSLRKERLETTLHPGSVVLRRAIRRNIVSFPAQVPVFLKQSQAGMQWRVVLLFFVRGWSSPNIAERFHVPTHRIWQILEDWSVRAFALGYVQVLDPEAFAACCRAGAEYGTNRANVQPGPDIREEVRVSHAAA